MKRSWITEISVILGVIGGGLLAGAQLLPTEATDPAVIVMGAENTIALKQWLTLIGTVMASIGGGGVTYRISKKAGMPQP